MPGGFLRNRSSVNFFTGGTAAQWSWEIRTVYRISIPLLNESVVEMHVAEVTKVTSGKVAPAWLTLIFLEP
jgi:hypothetical protein